MTCSCLLIGFLTGKKSSGLWKSTRDYAHFWREFPPETDLDDDDDDDGSEYRAYCSLLEKLLSRNRIIVVYNQYGNKCSNGSSIDRLYSLNRLYSGSATLVKESTLLRPLLSGGALVLVEVASADFQCASRLVSSHTDMLCELIQAVNVENLAPTPTLDGSIIRGRLKRRLHSSTV